MSDKVYEQIEDYLQGALSLEEKSLLEKRIKDDPAFGQEVDWMRGMLSLSKHQKEMEVWQGFNEIHNRGLNGQKHKIIGLILAVAAVLVLYFVFNKNEVLPKTENEQLALDSILTETPKDTRVVLAPEQEQPAVAPPPSVKDQEPAPPKSEPKIEIKPPIAQADVQALFWKDHLAYESGLQTLGDGEDSALDSALILMDAGEPVASLTFFEKYFEGLSEEDEDFEMRLIAGTVYLKELEDFSKAATQFQAVKDSDATPDYKIEADFYLGIVDWGNGNRSKAKKIWKSVATQEFEPWKSKARAFLDLLPD